jgi:hypothetical protein
MIYSRDQVIFNCCGCVIRFGIQLGWKSDLLTWVIRSLVFYVNIVNYQVSDTYERVGPLSRGELWDLGDKTVVA